MDTVLLPPFTPLPPCTPLNSSATSSLDLVDPFCASTPLPSLDQDYHSAPFSRKRKSLPEFSRAEQFIDVLCRSGWSSILMSYNNLTPNIPFPQWSSDSVDSPQHSLLRDDETDDQAALSATQNCVDDFEDVLNFLWKEEDTASTAQSAAAVAQSQSPLVSSASDQELPLVIADFDWLPPDTGCVYKTSAYGKGECCNKEVSGWEFADREVCSMQEEKCKLPSSWWQGGNVLQCKQQRLLQEANRPTWQDGLPRANWQAGIDSTWDRTTPGRASWQSNPPERLSTRASWPAGTKRVALAEGSSEQRAAGGGGGAGCSSLAWAGPTLLDIESALALTDNSLSASSTSCSTTVRPVPVSPFIDVNALFAQGDAPQLDSQSGSWRQKLQKRSSQEPKYTIKVESEEKALADGYRWRKYGQKSIKNSPFPRSYYRCSTGKCNAKKQVERCQEEEGLIIVTYEGIHLHHKPIMLHKVRVLGDGIEDEKETVKRPTSPSSSTSG